MTIRSLRNTAALATGFVLVAGAAACNNSDITSLNINPNSPELAPPSAVFTNAVQNSVSRWLGTGYDLRQLEFVAQHLAEVQYPDEDRYQRIKAGDTQGAFTTSYNASLEDFRQVIKSGTTSNSPAIYGPAAVMQQWEFGYLTDSWGDVPYSDALAGDSTGGAVLPKYDAQKDIYTGMFAKLTKATTDLQGASRDNFGGTDPIYGGSQSKWAKFSNSLRARYAIRLADADKATADAQLKAAFAASSGVFASNADNAQLQWPGDGVFNNPWSDNFKTRDDHRLSKTFYDILNGNSDPRLAIFAQPTKDFSDGTTTLEYNGQPNGLSAAIAGTYFTSTSRPGAIFYPGTTAYGTFGGNGAKQPSYLMTYAEVSFIKAEAAERAIGGLTSAQAAGFYNAGIAASLDQWGVDAASAAAYLAQPGIAYTSGTAGLKQIATQKWIALFSDGGQAWFEWRRTCQPSTIKAGPSAILTYVPRRLFYPTLELSVNGDNVAAAVARQGADNMATHVYWDKGTAPSCF